jgi:hypothetical protein
LTTDDALVDSIKEKELGNIIFKKKISKLEDVLCSRPLFVEPLSIIVPESIPKGTPVISSKVKKVVKMLVGIKTYVVENISKRLKTILEAWEVSTNLSNLEHIISSLIDYPQQDLENDENLYKNTISTFIGRVSYMDELTIN